MREWYCNEGDVCKNRDIVELSITYLEHFVVCGVVTIGPIASSPHEY
jgi:hypothetical protein